MSNTFDKLSVLDSFVEEVNSYLPEIETNLERLAQTPGDMDALEETYRRTHTIGGSASMMEFPGLAHVAHGMEDIFGDVLDGMATLDAPTLGLLQRSLGRMRRLLDGIHKGIDEDAIIAEDDADYTEYRSQIEMATQSSFLSAETPQEPAQPSAEIYEQADGASTAIETPLEAGAAVPSFDEMLASFRTPSIDLGEEVDWPEEPSSPPPVPQAEADVDQDTQPHKKLQPEPEPVQPSALEVLVATTRESQLTPSAEPVASLEESHDTLQEPQAATSEPPVTASEQEEQEEIVAPAGTATPLPLAAQAETQSIAVARPLETTLAKAYSDMQEDAQTLEQQASSLKKTFAQMRQAVSIIEAQRTEFRGFLDGSKDALDRMEDWAGKAMGLNLRNSPEQVRRYLPLSVMWVANSKLKKVLDILIQMAGSVEATEGQIDTALQQLQTSIDTCGSIFQQWQDNTSAPLFTHAAGWTPWEMQVSHEPEALRERVTFERRGDRAALRAGIEAQVRQELQQEYESRPLTLAARTELEQQIRSEILQEFEAQRQLQESVSGTIRNETIQEIEERLRGELEIQIRRDILSQLTGNVEGALLAVAPAESQPSVPTTPPAASQMTPPPPVTPMVSTYSSTTAPQIDFGEEAAEIFRLEAEEHLQTISMHVAALEKSPDDRSHIQGIRRAMHTLKGAASMMGFHPIADLCHISEDLLDSTMEAAIPVTSNVLSLILDTAEVLDSLINGKEQGENIMQSLRSRYTELLGEQSPLPRNVEEDEEELDAEIEASNVVTTSSATPVSSVVSNAQPAEAGVSQSVRRDLSVRVPLQKLDELVNIFGELLVNRSILEERLQRLLRLIADTGVSSVRLTDVGQKLESRFEAATLPSGRSVQVMPGYSNGNYNPASNGKIANNQVTHIEEFDELELDRYTEFHQLARGLSEGISDMTTLSNEMEAVIRECEGVFSRENRLSTTFQDRLMKARLVPLSTMTLRLYRTARAVALKQHKEFELVIEGQQTEVDRTVIEEIAGPLLHLIRNAVNHAIETPEVRLEKGKPGAGQIKLSAAYEGNQVVITVRDDGTGIDPERVRQSAIARGLIHHDQALSEADLVNLIFMPGFSTADVLSEESGRGVGLDVVRDSVSRLRGTLEVESMPDRGTAFSMKFPTSLAIQSAMMVGVADQQFAIPTVIVESIGRMDTYKQSMFAGRPAVVVQNELYPIATLAQYLGLPANSMDEKAPVLLLNTGRHRVALIVGAIKGKMEVVMKNLGPHLRHVRGIAGGTVLGNGRVVLVLEVAELLASSQPNAIRGVAGTLAAPTQSTAAAPVPQTPAHTSAVVPARSTPVAIPPSTPSRTPDGSKHILVVDDSASVRRVVSNMLKQHGWEVQVARDGVEALEMITRETPAAVLLDIEMPRMDGYELIATVRAQEQYRTLPIVILTSRAAAKHQQRAMQLGASDYLVKPYQDEQLINTLNNLIYHASVR